MNKKTLGLVVLISLWMPAVVAVSCLGGCQSGTTGVLRPIDAGVEHTITNTIVMAATGAQAALPFPWNQAIEGAGAAVLALLAAWQGLTHSRVKQIETNTAQATTKGQL